MNLIWFLKMVAPNIQVWVYFLLKSNSIQSTQLCTLIFSAFSQMQCNWRNCSQSYAKSCLFHLAHLFLIHFEADISLRMTMTPADAVFVSFNLSILAASLPPPPSHGLRWSTVSCLNFTQADRETFGRVMLPPQLDHKYLNSLNILSFVELFYSCLIM